jgi:hypothetical protein
VSRLLLFALGVAVGLLSGADTIGAIKMCAEIVAWSCFALVVISPAWMRGAK